MASCRGAWLHPLATVAGSCCGIHLDYCTHHHGGVVRDDAHTVPPVLFDFFVCNTSAIFGIATEYCDILLNCVLTVEALK